jgi:hypothetical protein
MSAGISVLWTKGVANRGSVDQGCGEPDSECGACFNRLADFLSYSVNDSGNVGSLDQGCGESDSMMCRACFNRLVEICSSSLQKTCNMRLDLIATRDSFREGSLHFGASCFRWMWLS